MWEGHVRFHGRDQIYADREAFAVGAIAMARNGNFPFAESCVYTTDTAIYRFAIYESVELNFGSICYCCRYRNAWVSFRAKTVERADSI